MFKDRRVFLTIKVINVCWFWLQKVLLIEACKAQTFYVSLIAWLLITKLNSQETYRYCLINSRLTPCNIPKIKFSTWIRNFFQRWCFSALKNTAKHWNIFSVDVFSAEKYGKTRRKVKHFQRWKLKKSIFSLGWLPKTKLNSQEIQRDIWNLLMIVQQVKL